MTAQAYLGAIGRTRTTTVHVTARGGALVSVPVYISVDAAASPALAEELRDGALNMVRLDGEPLRIAVPVIYHDPTARLLVLVLCEAHRHRELDERIRVLEQLRDDPAEIPPYAKDFAVVFGGAGLRAYLDRRARLRGMARMHDTDQFEIGPAIGPGIEDDVAMAAYAAFDAGPALDDGAAGPLFDIEPAIDGEAAFDSSAAALDDDPGSGSYAELAVEPAFEPALAFDAGPGGDARPVIDAAPASDAGPSATAAEPAVDADLVVDPASAIEVDAEPDLDVGPGVAPEARDAAPAIDAGEVVAGAAPTDAAPADATPTDAEPAIDAEASIESEIDDPTAHEATTAPDDGPVLRDTQPGVDMASGADPLTTAVTELSPDAGDGEAGQGEAAPREPGWHLDGTGVHLVLAVDESMGLALSGPLDLRLVLHRMASAPVIALVLGSPAALRAIRPGRLAVAVLDVAEDRDRSVLRALGRRFELAIDIATAGRRIRRCRVAAPLADNVGYLVRAADDHRRGVATYGDPDFARAQDTVLGTGFDLLGTDHTERAELRADRLAEIATARQLRRALAIARHFTHPEHEDYLVCTRGFPLSRWQQLRRDAVARAVAWGLWMGPELAQIAVSEGFARSRRDLVVRLVRGFEVLRHDRRAFDIDADTTADNAAAIAEQARGLGIELRVRKRNDVGAIASDAAPVTSGSIVAPLPVPRGAAPRSSSEELLAVLEEGAAGRGSQRLAAALALCDRGDPRAARPVVAAALKMSRGEAVRVLAGAVKLGAAAHPALIEGLSSSKAYLRHGCALALALGRSDEATQAVIALLLSEPTELWQEIARAIGEIGTPALVWLVRNVGQHGDAAAEERIALAMAHVAVRGGEPALTTMAVGDSIVSPIAAKALELLATVSGVRAGGDPDVSDPRSDREVSVNHAFSRQFFEALDREAPDDAGAEVVARNAPAAVES